MCIKCQFHLTKEARLRQIIWGVQEKQSKVGVSTDFIVKLNDFYSLR